jgi:hypothetical protein
MEMWSRASDRKDQVCSYDLLFGLKDGTEDIFFLYFILFFVFSQMVRTVHAYLLFWCCICEEIPEYFQKTKL